VARAAGGTPGDASARLRALQEAGVRTGPRYGILGGTFDPPHLGHLVLAQEIHARLQLDRVWFVPAGQPPHKVGHALSPAAARLAMVELAVADDPRFAVSDVEVRRAGPSYTAETLPELRRQWGESALMVLILGWDMLAYLPEWHAPERVLAGVDALAAVQRPGFAADAQALERLEGSLPGLGEQLILLSAPQLDISASTIRQRVASGLPIRYLVPDAVCHYVDTHTLYRSRTNVPRRGAAHAGGLP
jgi:nicotinate-nucleotide adenylyltransferase